ncbi:hypothetical protein B0H15DRAFT_557288 [Mycena belliarum]|uniref:Uncharacterized protein n=1 Tax=Mycena belliarum TaxID=1033014 RepID=A0AAD6XGR5_9AGAR|nr:hypothetical protein B0H15DRAFT_557288 [Mycena belliae]
MRPHCYSHGFHSWHGPRRATWFALGAASATLWICHRDSHHRTHHRYYGHCFRPPVPPMQPRPADPTEWRARDISFAMNNIPHAPPLPWGYPETHREYQWEEEKRKLQAIGKQAEDVMARVSEATLDSVMTSMEALKVKLAEHRAQREAAQRQLEEQLEEQRRNPHRFV